MPAPSRQPGWCSTSHSRSVSQPPSAAFYQHLPARPVLRPLLQQVLHQGQLAPPCCSSAQRRLGIPAAAPRTPPPSGRHTFPVATSSRYMNATLTPSLPTYHNVPPPQHRSPSALECCQLASQPPCIGVSAVSLYRALDSKVTHRYLMHINCKQRSCIMMPNCVRSTLQQIASTPA